MDFEKHGITVSDSNFPIIIVQDQKSKIFLESYLKKNNITGIKIQTDFNDNPHNKVVNVSIIGHGDYGEKVRDGYKLSETIKVGNKYITVD